MNLEQMAAKLEGSLDYRVLRRLPMEEHLQVLAFEKGNVPAEAYPKLYSGLFLDVESTGLNVDKDEIIELAAIPFKFEHAGLIMGPETPLHFYNEPNKPISDEITALTGITNDMVKGKELDIALLEHVFEETDLIVAHNARFDRQMVERYVPMAQKKCWGCSMEEVPWPKRGKRLEYIVSDMGYFYDAHNGIEDCRAALFALRNDVAGKPAFAHVLEAARATTWHVWTTGLPYNENVNELLKERKYYWNDGKDGRPKAWHRTIGINEQTEEIDWLQRFAYGPKKTCTARFDKVTAFDRYSKRV